MEEKQKIAVDIPLKLNQMLDETKSKLMITKAAVVKLACAKYCYEVLANGSD